MAINAQGIWGTDISYSRTIISSLPVIGTVMSFVNEPRLNGPLNTQLVNRPSQNEAADQRVQNNLQYVQELKTIIVYGVCSSISNMLSFLIVITLLALGVLASFNPWVVGCFGGITGALAKINSEAVDSHRKLLEEFLSPVRSQT